MSTGADPMRARPGGADTLPVRDLYVGWHGPDV